MDVIPPGIEGMALLQNELIAGVKILHLIYGGVALVVLIVLFKLFGKKQETDTYMLKVTCPRCGWSGNVGKYNRICRKCNFQIP